jgi:hypothetical protein
VSKAEKEKLQRKFDPIVEEILRTAVERKAERLDIYQTAREVRIQIETSRGGKRIFAKYPASTHEGLIDRIKDMADLPQRQTKTPKRSMIQVHLVLPVGERFIVFYVESRRTPRYKRHIILAPIWASISD